VYELIQIISDDERLHNEFPALKKVYVDTFRQLENEVLKLQPTTQREFRLKNMLAAILQDLQGATQGLYVSIFTTSNFHEFPQEKARVFKATIRGALKRFNYLSNEMERQVFSPMLNTQENEVVVEEEEVNVVSYVDIGDADCLFIDDMDKYEGGDYYASQNTEGF